MKLSVIIEQIHKDNPEDPSNPEVEIQGGGGVYELNQVKRNVVNRLEELAEMASKAETVDQWAYIRALMNNTMLNARIQTIIDVGTELEDRAGSTRSEMRDVPYKQ